MSSASSTNSINVQQNANRDQNEHERNNHTLERLFVKCELPCFDGPVPNAGCACNGCLHRCVWISAVPCVWQCAACM